MKIDKVVIKTNPVFTDSVECMVEMSDDHGIRYAYAVSGLHNTPNRVMIDQCVKAILVRYVGVVTNRYYVGVVTNRYYERTTQC